MTSTRSLLLSLALCGGLAAQAPAPPLPSVALPPELDRVLRDYERAWTAKDPEALARLFTPEGMALPSGQPHAQGAAAIRQAYAQGAGSPLSLRAVAHAMSGDLAYIIGGFAPAPGQPDAGKFVLVLRRGADGRWLIAADMDNASQRRPAAPPKPPGT
ncbi:MAG: SgcJ/EcaC family oxidoreductase [Holophagaceae bacterium]